MTGNASVAGESPAEVHLVDRLEDLRPGFLEPPPTVQMVSLGLQPMASIVQARASTVRLGPMRLVPARLRLACGIRLDAQDDLRCAVRFVVRVVRGRVRAIVFDHSLDPRRVPAHREWVHGEADLTGWAGERVVVELTTSVPLRHRLALCQAVWGGVVLAAAAAAPPAPTPRAAAGAPARAGSPRGRPHVVVIWADALRADAISPSSTPNIAALAARGCRAAHARASSPSSLGSTAVLLSGLHVARTGPEAEFGRMVLPGRSLPAVLREAGHRTILAPSHRELASPLAGAADAFDHVVAVAGRPFQDGMVTVRRLLRRVDEVGAAAGPLAVLVQLFDAHPPFLAAPEHRRSAYDADPTQARREHRPDLVGSIRGVEVAASIDRGLPLLEAGTVDHTILCVIRATRDALAGGAVRGPDLAEYLAPQRSRARTLAGRLLGRPSVTMARRLAAGRSPAAMVAWLDEQSDALERGLVGSELAGWLQDVRAAMEPMDEVVRDWLHGVVDVRYPLAMYGAAVRQVDDAVGSLVAGLARRALLEDAVIVLGSPHGLALGEHEIVAAHHALLEPCLRVPLVIAPPAGSCRPGAVAGGVIDGVDLMPTVLDAAGVAVPAGLDGASCWPAMRDGSDAGGGDSFSLDAYARSAACVSGGRKLHVALHDFRMSDRWTFRRGDRRICDLAAPGPDDQDDGVEAQAALTALEEALQSWLAATGVTPALPPRPGDV